MKMKKLVGTLAVGALAATLAIGGTMAYLQDTDSDVNVMTLGNVKIEQHEYQRVVNADGTFATNDNIDNQTSYVLEAFEQGKALLPIVGDPNGVPDGSGWPTAGWDTIPVRMSQVGSYGGMDVFAGKNAQDKFVTVENTGKTDAYIRTIVAIEVGDADSGLIGTSYHNTWTENQIGAIEIDGNKYILTEYVYAGGQLSDGSWRHEDGILPAGDTSYPNLSQVYIKSVATNEDMEAIDGNGNGVLDILVLSQAVQADGFADAQTALDTAFGKVSEKAAEWFANIANYDYVEAGGKKAEVSGEAAKEILETLKTGKDLIVDKNMDILAFDTNEVDAQGATVTLNGVGPEAYGYLSFLPDAGEDVTVSNLNVTGSGFVEVGHYGQGDGTYIVNNLKIENLAATLNNGDKGFKLGCAFLGFGDVTLNDCVMTGTTAVQDGVMPVDLGCGQNTGGLTNVKTTVNRGEYGTVYCWSHSIVTLNGAEIDTLYVAPIKGTVTIKAGTHVKTLNVAYGTSDVNVSKARLEKLEIEDGASVDAIVFRDTTYTVDEWNAFVAAFN